MSGTALEAALGGGIRKAPAAVAALDEEFVRVGTGDFEVAQQDRGGAAVAQGEGGTRAVRVRFDEAEIVASGFEGQFRRDAFAAQFGEVFGRGAVGGDPQAGFPEAAGAGGEADGQRAAHARPDEAEAEYARAAAERPRHIDAQMNLARLRFMRGDPFEYWTGVVTELARMGIA